ncbi:hypothetical protein RG47T_0294 [Mucilaginibacter polytrichastri]|uniref:Uncharacterized protein n=1 Tax=Mucilaginibacter polytrichastri TaxID=1302689 RepID=A0A1Q5ZSY4_9SPHI|nr:hypothetical protein RG47T_0294 [Mucilaginibacter polytrichastri]
MACSVLGWCNYQYFYVSLMINYKTKIKKILYLKKLSVKSY